MRQCAECRSQLREAWAHVQCVACQQRAANVVDQLANQRAAMGLAAWLPPPVEVSGSPFDGAELQRELDAAMTRMRNGIAREYFDAGFLSERNHVEPTRFKTPTRIERARRALRMWRERARDAWDVLRGAKEAREECDDDY